MKYRKKFSFGGEKKKQTLFIFQLSVRDNKIGMFCISHIVHGFKRFVFSNEEY